MLSKLGAMYIPSVGTIMLLNWIIAANLSFRMVNSPEFRCWDTYRNPGALLPSHRNITNLLMAKYRRAIPAVKSKLQLAKKIDAFYLRWMNVPVE
jgi:hypothetical protein